MNPIGIAVIGYGHWGAKLARILAASPHFSLAAIADVDPERRHAAAALYPGVKVCAGIALALAQANVAALAIATPPLSLFALARQALASGRHVFVEKPGAATRAEALILAEKAARAGLSLLVDLTPAWSPLQDAMAAALAHGAVGELTSWRAERANAGYGQPGIDVLRDLAIHDLAVLDALIAVQPTRFLLTDTLYGDDGRLCAGTMRLGYESGFAADIVVTWRGEEHMRRTQIVGTKGTLLRDDVNHPGSLYILDRQIPAAGAAAEPLTRALEGFANSIRAGLPPQTDAFVAARLLGWIEAARQSCINGRQTARASGSKP